MTPLTKFLNEIEERLKRATLSGVTTESGFDSDGRYMCRAVGPKHRQDPQGTYFAKAHADADFIANSRTDLERLLAIVKEQEHALAWYADKDNWSVVEDYDGYLNYGLITYGDIEESKYEGGFDAGGIRARAARARVEAIAKGET